MNLSCGKCKTILQTWQSVVSVANEESTYTPPDDVVRVAKSQIVAVMPTVSRGIRLLFDSGLQPMAAGVRGLVSARQFLYETDELYIDLRLEPQREAERMSLVGQVLDRTKTNEAVQRLPVRLQKGKLSVTHTATNQFGEFHFEFDAGKDLCLSIGRSEESEIVLPLYGIHGRVGAGSDPA